MSPTYQLADSPDIAVGGAVGVGLAEREAVREAGGRVAGGGG